MRCSEAPGQQPPAGSFRQSLHSQPTAISSSTMPRPTWPSRPQQSRSLRHSASSSSQDILQGTLQSEERREHSDATRRESRQEARGAGRTPGHVCGSSPSEAPAARTTLQGAPQQRSSATKELLPQRDFSPTAKIGEITLVGGSGNGAVRSGPLIGGAPQASPLIGGAPHGSPLIGSVVGREGGTKRRFLRSGRSLNSPRRSEPEVKKLRSTLRHQKTGRVGRQRVVVCVCHVCHVCVMCVCVCHVCVCVMCVCVCHVCVCVCHVCVCVCVLRVCFMCVCVCVVCVCVTCVFHVCVCVCRVCVCYVCVSCV
ncbi:hypothetical protein EYF80_055211 [Liparis tanakae]|uniref:Uncharacterized protein n=1 Tax=Liparis tanakae TaxID=230148 RepID=A0A4Z2F2B3_9TELE|nr:hypothetical protein EYF80_055211 [Liparis tanakae]